MMAMSPPLPTPLNAAPDPESDVRHEPLKRPPPDSLDLESTLPSVGTPLDPASIPIDPPNGSPPPPLGQLLDDVKQAELPSVDTPMDLDTDPVTTPPPTSNGINGHASPSEQPSSAQSPPLPQPNPTTNGVPTTSNHVAQKHSSSPTNDTGDQPPPAKRARKMSDAEQQDMMVESSTAVTSPYAPGPPSSAAPSPPSSPFVSLSQTQHRFCLSTVRTLKKLKDAAPFLHPVDPIALSIPHYTSVIKNPMDLGTVERKLLSSNPSKPDINPSNSRYQGVDKFIHDVKLIFQNCLTFNGPDHIVTQMGKRLETVFEKQIKQMPPNEEPKPVAVPKPIQPPPPVPPPPQQQPVAPPKKAAPPRRSSTSVPTIRRSETDQQGRPKREIHPPAPKDLPYADAPRKARRTKGKRDDGTQDQLKFCAKLLQDLHRKQLWGVVSPFYEPVDWVKLEIPSYPKIIKKPMDLGTMKKKLDGGEYPNAQKFYDDFKLMIRNCFTFNPEGTLVNQAGVELQKIFDDKWHSLPPIREVSEGDDDDEEDESEDEQAKAVAAMESQIEVLRGNLAAMKKKPKDKKKEKRKDKISASNSAGTSKSHANKPYHPGKSSKKNKKATGEDDVLSFEQKKDLSETIGSLDGPKLERVIQIIHEGVPEIRDSTEEIELDIDSLPPAVLLKLYHFVLRPIRPPKRSRGVGGGTGGLKRKSMDEDVEAERIRQLEQRIALFGEPNAPVTGGLSSGAKGDDSAESSDDSSDDSSGSDSE